MADTCFAFDRQQVTETVAAQFFSRGGAVGVVDTAGGSGFKVTADASGMKVSVAAGFAVAGGYGIVATTAVEVPVEGSESQPRIDLLVLRALPTSDTVSRVLIKGTAAASPTAPTPTAGDVVLAAVNVPASAATISAGDVTDLREYHPGGLRWSATASKWEWWNGASWVAFTVAWDAVSSKPDVYPTNWSSINHKPSGLCDGRKVTAGTSAPSGGQPGDIYLRYS